MRDEDYWMAYATLSQHGVRHPAYVAGCPTCWNMGRAEEIMEHVIDCPSPSTCQIDHDHLLGSPRPHVLPELYGLLEEE
jgi:hypothetical protein